MYRLTFVGRRRRAYAMAASRPVVYLDHGPMGQVAANPLLAARFQGALAGQGTLALSIMHAIEIANQGPGASMEALRALLHGVRDRFFLLDPDVFRASARRSLALAGATLVAPHEKVAESLRDFVPGCVGPVSASLFIEWALRRSGEPRALAARTKEGFTAIVEPARRQLVESGELPPIDESDDACVQCYFHVVFGLLRNSGAFKPNDGLDQFHAAVPIAVCDFVVLDGAWASQAISVPSPPRRAEVFSGRRHGLEDFLAALEAWTPQRGA